MTILAGTPADHAVPAKLLAEFHGVPKEYLSKSLQLLSNAGLVHTSLGPKGGYRLAKPATEISFLDIVEAVEGKQKTFNCTEIRRNNPCVPKRSNAFSSICSIAAIMNEADEAWRTILRAKKLSDVLIELEKKLDPALAQKSQEWFRNGGTLK